MRQHSLLRMFPWHHQVLLMSAAQHYSLYLRRYVETFDIAEDAAAAVAIACRNHAQLNSKALMRGAPLSRADYDAAPFIAEPLRKLDCCVETDCATAVATACCVWPCSTT